MLLSNITTCYQQLQALIPTPIQHWVVAFSGGVDSHVLLHWLCQVSDVPITVVHINHQLHQDAVKWQVHCQQICTAFPVTYISKTVVVDCQQGHSVEAAARDARYAALADYVDNAHTCLLTAHHQDDQAETVLLQLCRGAGVRGLAAMPAITSFANGHLARPFLTYSRQQLLDYATQQQLKWLDDPSNQSMRFDRNFMRHHVIPLLRERWPAVNQTLARSAAHCAVSDELNQTLAAHDYAQCPELPVDQLSLAALRALPLPRQANLLRYWLELNQLPLPSQAQLQSILQDVCAAKEEAEPLFVLTDQMQLRRYQDVLYVLSSAPVTIDATWQATWDVTAPLSLPYNLGQLQVEPTDTQPAVCLPDNARLTLRFRQGGERFQPHGRVGSHPLKKLCQEWHIPPWQRPQLLLGYWQQQLVFVCDLVAGITYYADSSSYLQNKPTYCWKISGLRLKKYLI